MATGAQVVQAIELILDQELHKLIKKREDVMVGRIGDLIAPLGIRPGSTRLALALRKIRNPIGINAAEELSQFRQKLGDYTNHLSDEDLQKLIVNLKSRIGDDDSELGMERSRLATISSILRPMSSKWTDRWLNERTDIDHSRLLKQTQDLREREIITPEELTTWCIQIHTVFREFVLYSPVAAREAGGASNRPIGTVNISNERVYERNWFKWTEDHSSEILACAAEISAGKRPALYRSNYTRPYGYETRGVPERDNFVYQDKSSASNYKVTISPAGSGSVSATRSWQSKAILIESLKQWVESRANVWGHDAALLDFTLEELREDSVTSAKQKTPDETVKSILTLLS